MKLSTALALQDNFYKERIELRKKKGKDYANEDDCLTNFKNVAKILGLLGIDPSKSYGVALIYTVLKLDRISNLVFRRKGKPSNEAIDDSISDILNYLDLFRECLLDDYKP